MTSFAIGLAAAAVLAVGALFVYDAAAITKVEKTGGRSVILEEHER
jgi:hypothetical protein